MTKDAEFQHAQQPMYPTQMPSAPPSYDEAMYGPQVSNLSYPVQPSVFPQAGIYVPNAGTYVQPPVVEVQRTIIALPLGPNPARIKCPNCNYDIRTSVESEPSCAAHFCCLLLMFIGCCPFSSLPYCMDSLKNVRHSCPHCRTFLGSYQP